MVIKFSKLFEPGQIGKMELKNRIVMPPMETSLSSNDGIVTARLIKYYAERARGGAGLITVEASSVTPAGRAFKRQLCIIDDRYLQGLSRLAEAIKKNGARAAIQLFHAGAVATSSIIGSQPVAPSSVERRGHETPRELNIREIKDIIRSFIDAADRAKRAGFDAVDLHVVHYCLLSEFLSPIWNQRVDEYGGSVGNRVRIVVEIIQGIKERLGDFPLTCRLNACELGADFYGSDVRGLSLEEGRGAARHIEKAGVDALHVSRMGWGAYALALVPDIPGALLPLAEAIKGEVSIPIVAVGRLTPEVGEKALKDGKADFIAVGRGLIADPYLPTKAREGKLEDIRPCIGCIKCLAPTNPEDDFIGLTCSVNPLAGREGQYEFKSVQSPKKVTVIGGGPAGMEAACTAAVRGHNVSLFETGPELGGQLLYADKAPGKKLISNFKEFLINRLKSLDVTINLNTRASPELIEQEKPDVVIIATGVIPFIPEIQGIGKSKKVVSALEVLSERVEVGERVVIIGGELVGCETADFLAERGRKVTVCEMAGKRLAEKISPSVRYPLLSRLRKGGCNLLIGVKYQEIREEGLVIIDSEGKERLLESDTIVIASGALSNRELYEALKRKFEVQLVGDCSEPRSILEATHEGFKAGFDVP